MEIFMKDSGSILKQMALASLHTVKELSMKGNGKMTLKMGLVLKPGLMGPSFMVHLMMV
jgi:hypothetical protein